MALKIGLFWHLVIRPPPFRLAGCRNPVGGGGLFRVGRRGLDPPKASHMSLVGGVQGRVGRDPATAEEPATSPASSPGHLGPLLSDHGVASAPALLQPPQPPVIIFFGLF